MQYVLLTSIQYVYSNNNTDLFSHRYTRLLQHTVHECLSAFANVNDQIEVWEVKAIKHHKIFKEYDDAIKLAQMILHRYDYNITNITTAEEEECPVFWIDMAMLYEHYVLGLLRAAYGNLIHYQVRGHTGYPDFVCYSPQVVLDTKYIPRFNQGSIDTYIVRQLSGYSRDKWIFPTPTFRCNTIFSHFFRETGHVDVLLFVFLAAFFTFVG